MERQGEGGAGGYQMSNTGKPANMHSHPKEENESKLAANGGENDLVSFIQYQHCHPVQWHHATLHKINEPPRSGHNYLTATDELGTLPILVCASVLPTIRHPNLWISKKQG